MVLRATRASAVIRAVSESPSSERCLVSGNERRIFQPSDRLRDRISSIELVQNEGGDLTILPTAGAVLGFQLRGQIRWGERSLAKAGVTGIAASARCYGYAQDTTSLLVRFTPQGASCLGVPVSELSDRSVALDDLLPRQVVGAVHEQLSEALTFADAVSVLQAFFGALPFARDRLLERAFVLLGGDDAERHVAMVAKQLSLSERQLERRMLERVGVTPKRYASLRRFERAAKLLGSRPSLAQVAQEAGYYDQSHFIREFRRFVGTSPGAYLRRAR